MGPNSRLWCRLSHTGAVAFVFDYQTRSGQRRRLALDAKNIGEAPVLAEALTLWIDNSADPLAERKAPAPPGPSDQQRTVADLARAYVANHSALKRTGHRRDPMNLNKHVLPHIGTFKVRDVKPMHLAPWGPVLA